MKFQKIKGQDGYVRDSSSQAVINKDSEAYNAYMMRKEKQSQKDKKIEKLEAEVADLKKFVNELIEAGIAGRSKT
jgi:cell division protein FtsB